MSMAKWQLDAYRRVVGPDKQQNSPSREHTGHSAGNDDEVYTSGTRADRISQADRDQGSGQAGEAGIGTHGSGGPGEGRKAGAGSFPGAGSAGSGSTAGAGSAGSGSAGGFGHAKNVAGTGASIGSDSGRRRQVAVLLNELGREQAAGVLRNLPPSLAEQIAHESLLMEPPDEQERAEVMRAFGFTQAPAGSKSGGTTAAARSGSGSPRDSVAASGRGDAGRVDEGFALTSRKVGAEAGADGHADAFDMTSPAGSTAKIVPSWTRAYEALELAFGPEKADRILHKAVPEAGRMRFSFLEELDVPQLKTLLSGETEHVVSLVVSQSKPEVAARVLKAVDDSLRRNIVARVARMKSLQPEIVDKVAESLKKRWREVGTEKAPETGGGVSTLAEIMKHLENKSLLDELSQQEPGLAGALRDEMYSIDMVLRVNDRQLAEILANFDDLSIALILKGKREEIRAKIMHNVSERRATMVSEEYRELGPQRREDVDEVTHEFVEQLRSRAEDGSLLVDDSDERYI